MAQWSDLPLNLWLVKFLGGVYMFSSGAVGFLQALRIFSHHQISMVNDTEAMKAQCRSTLSYSDSKLTNNFELTILLHVTYNGKKATLPLSFKCS